MDQTTETYAQGIPTADEAHASRETLQAQQPTILILELTGRHICYTGFYDIQE